MPLPLAPRRNVAWQGLQLRAQTPGATRAHGHRDKLTHYSLFVFKRTASITLKGHTYTDRNALQDRSRHAGAQRGGRVGVSCGGMIRAATCWVACPVARWGGRSAEPHARTHPATWALRRRLRVLELGMPRRACSERSARIGRVSSRTASVPAACWGARWGPCGRRGRVTRSGASGTAPGDARTAAPLNSTSAPASILSTHRAFRPQRLVPPGLSLSVRGGASFC